MNFDQVRIQIPAKVGRYIANPGADTPTVYRKVVSLHVKRDPEPPNFAPPAAALHTINGFKIGPTILKACGKSPAWESTPNSQWDPTLQIVSFKTGCLPSLDLEIKDQFFRRPPPGIGSHLTSGLVYFVDSYDLVCELQGPRCMYYDAYKQNVNHVNYETTGLDKLGPHSLLKVDRLNGLDAYFPYPYLGKAQDYLHFMLLRQTVSVGRSEVWMLDVEVVDNFEGNPWA